MAVRIQSEDFDISAELTKLRGQCIKIGALVTFTGLVRDTTGTLISMTLEHYPGMTEQALSDIEDQAHKRWALSGSLIIHRYGTLKPGAQIMMVATVSPHRKDAFEAAEFLMDYLKTDAPFWKKEHHQDRSEWVAHRIEDTTAKERWKI